MKSKVAWAGALGALLFGIVCWSDYDSGFNLDFSLLYYVPVALWAWYLGVGPAVAMACVGGLGSVAKDFLQAHAPVLATYEFWNGAADVAGLLAIAIVVHLLHRRLLLEITLRARLSRALSELETTAGEISRLQHETVMICPVTRRIGVAGEWVPLDAFLKERLALSVQETVSEEALAALMDRVIEYHDAREAVA